MLNYPDIDYEPAACPCPYFLYSISDRHTKLCGVVMQKFANHIMRGLYDSGSNIRFFAACPGASPSDMDRPAPDANVRRWPKYYYLKARVTNDRGQEDVVASPSKGALEEMKGSWVIYHNV
jgi:hypothetical protein